jgi:hypothetical protein
VKFHWSLCAAALAATLPAPAAAEDTIGVRRTFEQFSQCVAARHHDEAEATVLSTEPGKVVLAAHSDVVDGYCLRTEWLKLENAEYLRFGLADALLRLDYAKGLPADIAQAAPLAHPEVNEADYRPEPDKTATAKEIAKLQQDLEDARAGRTASIFAECVARADPGGVLALVLTEPVSDAEKKAFAELQPPLNACLPKTKAIRLDALQLRGALAMNLYRLAKAPRANAAGPK